MPVHAERLPCVKATTGEAQMLRAAGVPVEIFVPLPQRVMCGQPRVQRGFALVALLTEQTALRQVNDISAEDIWVLLEVRLEREVGR